MRKKQVNDAVNSAPPEALPVADKPLFVLHGEIKTPPMSGMTRVEAGFYLRSLQQGVLFSMPLSRPMPNIGSNCHELRLADADRGVEWRIVYCIDDAAIVVLDIFEKKTRTTLERNMQAYRQRLSRYLAAKEEAKKEGNK